MVPMCLLVMVCCGPGAGALTLSASSRPLFVPSAVRSRTFAGLLHDCTHHDPLKAMVHGSSCDHDVSFPTLAEWTKSSPIERSEFERREFDSEFDSGSRLSALGSRLSAFGDLVKEANEFCVTMDSVLMLGHLSHHADSTGATSQIFRRAIWPTACLGMRSSGRGFATLADAVSSGAPYLGLAGYRLATHFVNLDKYSGPNPDPLVTVALSHAPSGSVGRADELRASPLRDGSAATHGDRARRKIKAKSESLARYGSSGIESKGRVPSVEYWLQSASSRVALTGATLALGAMWTYLGSPLCVLSFMLMSLPTTGAVCIHCKDTIEGCTGGDDCPAFKDWATNTAIFMDKKLGSTPRIGHALVPELSSHFPRPIVDAIVGLACAPEEGSEVDFESAAYAKSNAVVQAAMYGFCSPAEAMAVLAKRLEDADGANAIAKVKGAMDSLKLVTESVVSSSSGAFTFIWTKLTTVLDKRLSGVAKIELNSEKGKANSLVATMVKPTTEARFYELLHYFIMLITGLGIASYFIVAKFVDEVAFATIRMGDSWTVAFELVGLYLRKIDRCPTRTLHLGNVYDRGGQDTMLTEARRNSAAFFRTRGGEPRDERPTSDPSATGAGTSKPKPNGRFDSSADKCCVDFNMGRPCTRLKTDGTCKFNHRCNQFVSDKGPGGVCFGTHARCMPCDYDESKKLRQALK